MGAKTGIILSMALIFGVGLASMAIQSEKLPNFDVINNAKDLLPAQDSEIASNSKSVEIGRLIHHKVNNERLNAGLQALQYDYTLEAIATAHSADMAARNYFSHVTPDGRDFSQRYLDAGYSCTNYSGENILLRSYGGQSSDELAAIMVKQWMDSEGHRANILLADFQREGVGVVYDGVQKNWLVTQNFC